MANKFLDLLGTTLSSFGIGPKATRTSLDASGLTAPRTFTLPDADGTPALTNTAPSFTGATFSGDVALTNAASGSHWIKVQSNSGTTYLDYTSGVARMRSSSYTYALDDGAGYGWISTHFVPLSDNAYTCGIASKRWKVIYAATGTINTSDARDKTAVTPLSDAEIAWAKSLAAEMGTYQFLDAVAAKGASGARLHLGMTVQRAIELGQAQGLDPTRYGFICHDEWDEQPELWSEPSPADLDENGNVIAPARPSELLRPYRAAGDRYSFRPDELLLFIARGFDARLSALEAKAG